MNNYHSENDEVAVEQSVAIAQKEWEFTYTFENFFHPFVGELIAQLNKESLSELLDATFHEGLRNDKNKNPEIDNVDANDFFFKNFGYEKPQGSSLVQLKGFPKEIDVSTGGPYANYNWELLFHVPLMIGVHLSKNQRFAEAQRWFHYIFDPTSNDESVEPKKRFWKFLAFRNPDVSKRIEDIVAILSMPRSELSHADQELQDEIWKDYTTILNKPFQPHAVARTRPLAYQYYVVMKYLDNLIAWGDQLFQQDTVESINEATQLYVLAANILGERPQLIPRRGTVEPKTFARLKEGGLGPIGNAFVDMESQFPFNSTAPNSGTGGGANSSALFGIGRTLYFCIPPNEKLLSYWDTVADRLFKIRHCMNIAGVVRPLALFDPPIDPGMLVKAAGAGIEVGSIVSGLNQPIGAVRCVILIQKALELAGEVRGLGASLLSAIEKGDGERLALLRQGHEIKIQQMQQDVRFLQWKQAQEATESLLRSRVSALEKYRYYLRLLGQTRDTNAAPDTVILDRRDLTEENFDETYAVLVGQYEKPVPLQVYPPLSLAGETSPANQSLLAGQGKLYLNTNEDAELNEHAPESRWHMNAAKINDSIAEAFVLLPDININIEYWGIGSTPTIPIGELFARVSRIVSTYLNTESKIHDSEGSSASKTASYERRADEWMLQANLAARELMQIGRQIIGSLIAEQIAYREYANIQRQIEHSQEVDQFLREKFTHEELYAWMQGEISRLYYEYYRFAFDTARRAERTMKHELMRPEVDAMDYIKFNYWDGGRKGLLSGEALYLDIKRMEMAYHEHNKRELELTKHVSLRQLNPVALLALKAIGTCQVTIPEWLYDLDCPGHYMRRIKSVALSIPSVVGPYTSVNCTLSLLKSSLRKSPLLKDGDYLRRDSEDDRFVDYIGTVQSIVSSTGQNDSGMFEMNLSDERFLPFEDSGAESTWKLDLPKDYRSFDYNTIADVILHIRYTARQGVDPNKVKAALDDLFQQVNQCNLAVLFSLRHDFPSDWSKFVIGTGDLEITVRREHFPYFTQGKKIAIDAITIHAINAEGVISIVPQGLDRVELTAALDGTGAFQLSLSPDPNVLVREQQAHVFLVIKYLVNQA